MVRAAPGDRFVCFLDERAAGDFHLQADNLRSVIVALGASPTTAAGADSARSPLDMLRLTRAVARERVDVFFSPTVYSYFPLPPGLAAVVTIHDAIAERFPELTLPTRRARLFWGAKVGLALRQARLVLTVSDYAAGEIAAVLGVATARIRVASEAPADAYRATPDPAAIAAAVARVGLAPEARWFTYVGGFNPHKHVDLLVQAHAAAAAGRANPPHLLLVGTRDGDVFHGAQGAIHAAIATAGTAELVHWTGWLPDEELRHLHAGAIAAVLPSASEGFGLPAVEAAACGAPVVATTASPLPGLLAGGGIFVAPGDPVALTAALIRLLDDEPARRTMGAAARARAMALSWEAGARAALSAVREAAA
jgi:glycosyltransferase involved in cell wall biosynthesis